VCQSFQHRAWIAVDLGSQNQSLRSKQKTNEGGNLLKIVFMDSSNQASEDLEEVKEAISVKAGNLAFLKKFTLEKGGTKFLAISTNRILLLSTKAPYKIDASFHFLEIQSVESKKPLVAQLKVVNEKTYVLNTEDDDDILFVVAQTLAFLRYNFPGSKRYELVELNIEPTERLSNIQNLAAALANPGTDSEIGPCGGFSLSYSSVCDLHGVAPMAEVIWDIDKIYGSHDCKDFSLSDFDHLEGKELIPIITTFEFNTWFRSFSCRSYKLSHELVDIIAKVLKSNCSIEELDFYECRLSKENIQKIAQAVASNAKTALKKLNFGKNAIDDRGVPSLSNVLSSLPHGLESLLIKDVNITGKGISSICSALKSNSYMPSSLTSLNVSSNPLKVDGASAVCELLANANVIQELHLSNTECSFDLVFGALARGCLQHLKILNLSGNPQLQRKGKDLQVGPSVTKFFSSSMALQSVDFSNTKISPEFLKAILIGLISNKVLKDISLLLAGNELRSAGAAEICSCVAGLGNVIHLDLRDNSLDMDIVSICHSMQKNKSLQILDLSQNIGKSKSVNVPAILESIVEMVLVESLPLRTLSVADNRLKQDACVIIDSLGTNDKLEEVDISGNLIGDEGAKLFAKALQINTKLRKISLDRNGITLKGFESLAASMKRNYSLQLLPVPFSDIYPLMKSNGEAVKKCFEKIDELLLRNQSMGIVEADHSMKLKQNILLSSLDLESTDRLLVEVQGVIDELKDADDDETVSMEVENGKESIKDADRMKQVLFKRFMEFDDPSKMIEERADKLLKEMTDFADGLVETNVDGTLDHLKEQCPTIAKNNEAIEMLASFISEKGKVDSLGLKEMIARKMVKLISNKVSDATLNVVFAFGEYLTKIMQESLSQSKVNLSLLSREYKDKKQANGSSKKGGSLPTTSGDEKDESVLAAQKAKNRISTQIISEDGKGTVKGISVTRRPTFRREKDFKEIAVEISIDEGLVVDEIPKENPQQLKDATETVSVADAQNEETASADTKKEKDVKSESEAASHVENSSKMKVEKSEVEVEKSGEKKELTGEMGKPETLEKAQTPDASDKVNSDKTSGVELSKKLSPTGDDVKRAGSVSVKQLPKLDEGNDRKPRPLSDISLSSFDQANIKELVHLNKGRAKPKGRRPPTKASGLAHLQESELIHEEKVNVVKEAEKPAKPEKDSLKVSPKPRPKSMQTMESPSPEKEMGVIRTGSIPHKSSESLKERLQAGKEKPSFPLSSKPDLKTPPKPSLPKKEDSLKKPKPAVGKPIPGLPSKPNIESKTDSPTSSKEDTDVKEIVKPCDSCESDTARETVAEDNEKSKNEAEEKVDEKPKPKVYRPPGAVPMMGGPMGLGGALMAEMKKKRSIKNKDVVTEPAKSPASTTKTPMKEKQTAPSPPAAALRPTPAARKPPPPAKLSAEKRRSLILESGSKPIIPDKVDGPKTAVNAIAEHGGAEKSIEEKSTVELKDPAKESHDATVEKDSTERNNNSEISENTAC